MKQIPFLSASALIIFTLTACGANQPPSRRIAALQAAERGELQQPALVEFYSNDCWACRQIQGPMFFLDQRYDGKARFIYFDADSPGSQPVLAKYQVRGIPTIVLLDAHGRVAANIAGWPGEQAIADALDKLAATP